MRVILTRDSVCAGDDGDAPHKVVWDYAGEVSGREVLERAAEHYCIHMANASWVAYEARGRAIGRAIAVISAERPTPRPLPGFDPSIPPASTDGIVEIHFRYDCRYI